MTSKKICTSYGLTNSIGRKQIRKAFEECKNLGFQKDNIILSGQQRNDQEVLNCDFYYCTEGNTFETLHR